MSAQKHHVEITRMARLLKVSRSGYYAWDTAQRQGPSPAKERRRRLDAHVGRVYAESDDVYGAPRVAAQLAREGISADRKTVAASMRRQGLEGISPRMFTPVTTFAGTSAHRIRDRVNRTWDRGDLDLVWVSDVTYLRTGQGWLYLCVITDGHSRRVLGYAMDTVQDSALIERALRRACFVRGGRKPDNVVFHADRGAQFTSEDTYRVCSELGLSQSVGRTGICFDNAMAESVWATLKTEFYNRRSWPTRAEARTRIAEWIERIYNRRRLHSSIGMLPPVEYETTMRTRPDKEEGTSPQLNLVA